MKNMKMNKPYKIYGENIEHEALKQFFDVMNQDFVIKGALMPDSHLGYSLPIGGVVLTDNFIVPSYVGFDISCGVCALKTNYTKEQIEKYAQAIFDRIYELIPVGRDKRKKAINWRLPECTKIAKQIFYDRTGFKQLGTLGGGNHYLSIGYDSENYVWIECHSGSRGVGHGIATHYMKLASGTNKAKEGHYGFELNSENGQNYLKDMNFCLEFALRNRQLMVLQIEDILSEFLDGYRADRELINRNHNHAEVTDEGIIHRKGATHAEYGMVGVIPGNMRDGSFIVRGLGNPESLCSSSHGAGRVLGRKQAKKTLNQKDFEDTMDGIICETKDKLDESPDAYKNIFDVMKMQKGLVEIIHHIKPLINIKG